MEITISDTVSVPTGGPTVPVTHACWFSTIGIAVTTWLVEPGPLSTTETMAVSVIPGTFTAKQIVMGSPMKYVAPLPRSTVIEAVAAVVPVTVTVVVLLYV
jgi:hypothetical protein